jgi:hypothetical protein
MWPRFSYRMFTFGIIDTKLIAVDISKSIENINTLFSLFHQEKKEIREAVQP